MSAKPKKTAVFLDAAPPERAAYAANLFAKTVERLGYPWAAVVRTIDHASADELEAAARVVCVGPPDARPAVEAKFPTVAPRVEFWPAPMEIDERVNTFVATLLGGGFREVSPPPPPPVKKLGTAKVGRETAGRKGKGVTVIWELGLPEAQLQELATSLKQKCGTGGTVKDGRIEIQGDHRDRIVTELEKIGYKVKRAGG